MKTTKATLTSKQKQQALTRIAKEIGRCKICRFNTIGQMVPGKGNPNAKVVLVGEAPGKKEAASGKPFIGPAGKVLREQIAKAGLKDKDIFITSAIKFLPKHVTPKPKEIDHARPHLFKQLAVIKPKVVVLLGKTAVYAVLEQKVAIAQTHGKLIEQDGIKYLIAYHPAAPLYSGIARKGFENDFKKLKKLLSK